MSVTLEPVTRANVRAVCELEGAPGQEQLVAPAAFTVAEGHYEPGALLRAIVLDGRPVGVVLVEVEDGVPDVVRFLVDRAEQRRGIGARAVALLAAELRAAGWSGLETSFVPVAGGAGAFWRACGFRDTGRVRHGEPVHAQGEAVVVLADPAGEDGVEVLAAYMRDIVGRWFGRPVTEAEVAEALADFPSDDLAAPSGCFLLARDADGPVGCAGLRWLGGAEAEMTRVGVLARGRRRGWARRLVGAVEEQAREHGCSAIRLEVRGDLVEAQRLYAACGYRPVPAFSSGPYVDHWLRKELS